MPEGFRKVKIKVESGVDHTLEELKEFIKKGFKLRSSFEEEERGVIWVEKREMIDGIPVRFVAYHPAILRRRDYEEIKKMLEEAV